MTIRLIIILSIMSVLGCEREWREFRAPSSMLQEVTTPPLTNQTIGPAQQRNDFGSRINAAEGRKAERNAYELSEGKRLYQSFNCYGCHKKGGGDMGPPLMDSRWIYGSSPEDIFVSITRGREKGMPSFGSKMAEYQVWQLVAYVRSLSGLVSPLIAPGRDDDINAAVPENSRERQTPITFKEIP